MINLLKVNIIIAILFLSIISGTIAVNDDFSAETYAGNKEDMIKFKMKYSNIEDSNCPEDYYFDELNFVNNQIELIHLDDNIQTTNPDDGLMDSAWPMKCHDARHTSQSPYSTEGNPHTEIWRFKTSSDIEDNSAAVDDNGNIYVASVSNSRIYALYPNGNLKWSFMTDGLIWGSSPAIAEDGTVYFGSWDAGLYALYQNGTKKWRFGAGDSIASSPAIEEDGIIYFGTMGNKIFAVNSDGTEKWQYTTGNYIVSDPAIGQDGIIYVGSADGYLYAMNPNGTLRWKFGTGNHIKCSPSISEDGVIYINSWDNYLYAIYPNGTLKWKTNVGWGMSGSASIAEDGTIYFFTQTLDAYYPNNGTLKWRLDVGGNGGCISPAISADGTIYVCNHEGKCIIAVSPEGEEIWRKQISNLRAASSPIIDEDGTIYVGTSWIDEDSYWFGNLHAFGLGELNAVAGGPYSGNAEETIQFEGTVFGGALPYTYLWNFGDGNTSDLLSPEHSYSKPGEYIATFTVVDGQQNISSDIANVTIGTSRPKIEIIKPYNALYFANFRLLPLPFTLIIGKITVEVDAYQEDVGIDRVCFYVDSELVHTDYDEPYQWTWEERMFFGHRLAVYAISNDDKSQGTGIDVWKLF